MKKKFENIIPAERPEFMTLKFFSARFGIKEEYLSWGIRKVKTNEKTFRAPIVIIKGESSFIDIERDTLMTKKDIFGKTKIYHADIIEAEDRFVFFTSNCSALLSKKDALKLYAGKYFPEA